ncbi:hypothetical protein ABES28_08595 [Bacillus licheniformis]|uniref:Uncharacterized protein n=1 Tax=Bacillus licheniformis TaxID=1402 RepID=A0AB37GPF1_BACLI|nr:hypothetical protein [Bacillus licheniformis]ARC67822.1 hypothetical protein B34_00379 [Bacillus licheniformis]MDE1421330.1 hypothetical protein [Bacillus licheniformis]MED4409649.1 hypothetical protein [Bacillus licheniformis]QDL79373.1 hypothetical protein D9Y32_19115 [Bacillus licheniformis]QPR71055.1 hypothetical protein I6G80_14490 [Bacillus licheniformis]
MTKKTVIHDTADVYWRRKSDGHVISAAEAQLASISQSISEEELKGGIGNRTLYLLRTDKSIDAKVKNAFFDMEFMAMTQGVAIEENKFNVSEREDVTVQVDGTVKLQKTPVGVVSLKNSKGASIQAEYKDEAVTVPDDFAKEGDVLTAVYRIEVTGETVEINSNKFSEMYELEYHTIEYDPDTGVVYSDLYIQFDKVAPSGEFEMSLENGAAYTPELSFKVLAADSSGRYGRFARVPRTKTNTPDIPSPSPDTGTQTKAVDIGD